MTPDLKVWRNVAIMLFVSSLFLLYRLSSQASLAYQVFDHYKARITDLHRSGRDTISVLFLGTSLTKYALGPSESTVIQRLESALKQPVRLERMVINSVDAELLLHKGIPDHLNRYFPDYVFLEGNMFVRGGKEEDQAAWDRNFTIFYMTKYPLSFLYITEGTIHKIVDNLKNEFLETYRAGLPPSSRTDALKEIEYVPISTTARTAWTGALYTLSKNASVILIHYPILAASPSYNRQIDNVLEALAPHTPEAIWEMPDSMITEKTFLDGAHMSPVGSGQFADWITQKLSIIHDKVN